MSSLSASFTSIMDWKIDEICIISRSGSDNSPFKVKHTIQLKGKPKQFQSDDPSKQSREGIPLHPVVKEAPPPFPFSTDKSVAIIAKSVSKWLKTTPESQLPRTKEGFLNAIKSFCNLKIKVLEEDYIITKLVVENFIEVDTDGDVFLVERKFHGFPPVGKNLPYHYTHDLKEAQVAVLQKCIEWSVMVSYPPNSLEKLKSSICQLCFYTFTLQPTTIAEHLTTKNLIQFDENKKVKYLLLKKTTATNATNTQGLKSEDS